MQNSAKQKNKRSLVVTGYIGLGGTAVLAGEYRSRMDERFPRFLSREAIEMGNRDRLYEEEKRTLEIIKAFAPDGQVNGPEGEGTLCVKAGEGGFLTAMYQMAEASGAGFETDLRKVPIRQETIEICELLEVNPYHLYCGGCIILMTKDAGPLISELEKDGINAVVIGYTNDKKSHVLFNDGTESHLNRPQPDELERLGLTDRLR